MSSASEYIKQCGISFGTSGARGLVSDFSPRASAAFTFAFLKSQNMPARLALGMDNRPSSPDIASACIAAAKHLGVTVDFYGVLPTPALAHTALGDDIPSIMVTGSHIPFDRNGLKFYRADGEISKQDEIAILSADIELPEIVVEALPEVSSRAVDNYKRRFLDIFPAKVLEGKRIGIYEHSSAGRDIYAGLFESLGAEVVALGRSDSFVPIDTEAVAEEDMQMAQGWQKTHHLDAVFSTDGDGDRPLLSDETGRYLRGDILCLLAAQALGVDTLAVPVSCNTSIESSALFDQVARTKIGSPYVIDAMKELNSTGAKVAGFEANGGFLLGSDLSIHGKTLTALATRDAVLPVLAVLTYSPDAQSQSKISDLVAALPQRYTASDRVKDFPREKSVAILQSILTEPSEFLNKVGLGELSVTNIDQTDGVRVSLSDGSIVHLRPSGNAPELRCYTEADTEGHAGALLRQVFANLV